MSSSQLYGGVNDRQFVGISEVAEFEVLARVFLHVATNSQLIMVERVEDIIGLTLV
jgi:hypothetical protein